MDKKLARRAGLQHRSALSISQKKYAEKIITQQVIKRLENISSIGIYISMEQELSTDKIIQYALEHQITVCVPKVENGTLTFYYINEETEYSTSRFGVKEPVHGEVARISELNLMFVPLSSFDAKCHRTGYGKGYYDRILEQCRHTIGLAFSVQEVESIAIDAWDNTLDEIITEKEVYKKDRGCKEIQFLES